MNAPESPPLLLTACTGGVLRLILNRPQRPQRPVLGADGGAQIGAGRRRGRQCHPGDRDRRRQARSFPPAMT